MDEIEVWLKENKGRLSIRAIEQELKIPSTTLSKVANGTMKLPKKWERPLIDLKNQMCGGKKSKTIPTDEQHSK